MVAEPAPALVALGRADGRAVVTVLVWKRLPSASYWKVSFDV